MNFITGNKIVNTGRLKCTGSYWSLLYVLHSTGSSTTFPLVQLYYSTMYSGSIRSRTTTIYWSTWYCNTIGDQSAHSHTYKVWMLWQETWTESSYCPVASSVEVDVNVTLTEHSCQHAICSQSSWGYYHSWQGRTGGIIGCMLFLHTSFESLHLSKETKECILWSRNLWADVNPAGDQCLRIQIHAFCFCPKAVCICVHHAFTDETGRQTLFHTGDLETHLYFCKSRWSEVRMSRSWKPWILDYSIALSTSPRRFSMLLIRMTLRYGFR